MKTFFIAALFIATAGLVVAQDTSPPDVAVVTVRCEVNEEPAECQVAYRSLDANDNHYQQIPDQTTPMKMYLEPGKYELMVSHETEATLARMTLEGGTNPDVVIQVD